MLPIFPVSYFYQNSILTYRPDWTNQLNQYRVEACWKLGKWDTLESYLKPEKHNTSNWNVGLGKILLAAKQRVNCVCLP